MSFLQRKLGFDTKNVPDSKKLWKAICLKFARKCKAADTIVLSEGNITEKWQGKVHFQVISDILEKHQILKGTIIEMTKGFLGLIGLFKDSEQVVKTKSEL